MSDIASAGPTSLAGRWIALRPIFPPDYEILYSMATAHQTGFRWRYRGAVPHFEMFVQTLHADVLAQFVVVSQRSGQPIGMVVAYCADLNNGTTYMAELIADEAATGLGVDAAAVFTRYLFRTWALRKVYMEVPEYNLPQFESAIPDFLEVEGRLRDHLFYGDRLWDMLLLSATRESAGRFVERFDARH